MFSNLFGATLHMWIMNQIKPYTLRHKLGLGYQLELKVMQPAALLFYCYSL